MHISTKQPNTLQWCHMCHAISNHWQLNCLLNSFLWMITKKHQNSVLLALCQKNPPVTGGFPSQRARYVESISMLWCHHDFKSPGIFSRCFICPPSPYTNAVLFIEPQTSQPLTAKLSTAAFWDGWQFDGGNNLELIIPPLWFANIGDCFVFDQSFAALSMNDIKGVTWRSGRDKREERRFEKSSGFHLKAFTNVLDNMKVKITAHRRIKPLTLCVAMMCQH